MNHMAKHLEEGKEEKFKLDYSSQLKKEVRLQETILNAKQMFLQPNESIKKPHNNNNKNKLFEMQCFGKMNQPTKTHK